MYNLIKKDFLINRHMLSVFASFPFYFIILFWNKDGAGPAFSISVIWALILPFLLLSQEEKNNGYPLLCSMPVSKKNLFISKYLSAWLVSVLALSYFLLIGYAIAKLLNTPFANSVMEISPTDIFVYLFLAGINISVFFPLLIRFGSVNSTIVGIVIINFIGIILFTLKKKTGFFSYIVGFAERSADAFRAFASVIRTTAGDAGYYIFLLIILFLLNYFSYRILLLLFRKREL